MSSKKVSSIIQYIWQARPDFAELDVFLRQHILWPWNDILIQDLNLDHFPTPKLTLTISNS